MRRMLLGGCSAAVFAATLALGSSALLAQSEGGAMWGEGEDRLCNVVIDTAGNAVLMNATPGVVIQNKTYECPEQVAAIEPAAPAPLAYDGTVYFDFDKYSLTPEQQARLDDIIFDIKDRELAGVVVNGYTDTAGTAEYNMELSQERANTVAADLVQAGIPADIVTTEAWGQTHLAVPTPDGVPDAANRRVVLDYTQ